MRKLLISTMAAVASLSLVGSFAPGAFAIGDTTTTSEVAGYPPVPTSSTTTTEAESLGPVVITPDPDADAAGVVIVADLPSTGRDSAMPLRLAGGLLVAGVLAVFAVRRRRHASPEPAA